MVTGDKENLANIRFAKPGEVFRYQNKLTGELYSPLPYKVPGMQPGDISVMTGARRLILAGNDPNDVIMYYQSQFGIPGEVTNLMMMMALNPLNYSSKVESAADEADWEND